jgi:hypothetical protein
MNYQQRQVLREEMLVKKKKKIKRDPQQINRLPSQSLKLKQIVVDL